MHREEGYKASEGCVGVFQEAKGEGIPGSGDSRSKGLEVGVYNVPESTWLVSGQNEEIMSPKCAHEGLGERKRAGTWVGDQGVSAEEKPPKKLAFQRPKCML